MQGADGSHPRNCIATSMFTPTSPRNPRHEARYATWIPQMIFSARTLFHSWEVLVYHDRSVLTNVLQPTLDRIRPHATLILVEPANYVRSGCFWRLYAFDECDVVFWRDIELIFEPNDVFLVHDFLNRPEELAYVQAIHPREWTYHRCVLAGIYLAKRNASHPNPIHMRTLIEHQFLQWQYFGADEVFLCNTLHSLRPSVVYYEPQQKVSSTVRLHNELSHMETYVPLAWNYSLIGQKPGSTAASWGLDEEYSDAWRRKFRQLFLGQLGAQHGSGGHGGRQLVTKPQNSLHCFARGRALTWSVAAQCERAQRSPEKIMIVSHPDDELFFGFEALSAARCGEWLVLCITNASPNSSYPEGKCSEVNAQRRFEFEKSIRQLGAHGEVWDFQDRFTGFNSGERIDLAHAISEKLSTQAWVEVATHNVQGEYGHAQHKQLHTIVHEAVKRAQGTPRFLTFHLDVTRAPAPFKMRHKQIEIATRAYPQRVVHLHNELANWTKFATLAQADTHAASPQLGSVAGGAKRQKSGADDTGKGISDSRWSSELDRQYMKSEMFPRAGKLAGADGKVLDVGYMQMNADDSRLAGVDASRWYFVEPVQPASFDPRNGQLLGGTLAELAAVRRDLRQSFRVIIDYGVLGWTMCRDRSVCDAHIDGLPQLLAPGGTLLLKWDCKSSEQLDWWEATRTRLLNRLQLVEIKAVYAASCSREHLDRLKQEGGVEPRPYTDGVHPKNSRCQAYFMTEWRSNASSEARVSRSSGGNLRDNLRGKGRRVDADGTIGASSVGGRSAGGQREKTAVDWDVRIAYACLAALALACACGARRSLLTARTALLMLLVVQSTSAVLLMRYSNTRAVVGPRYLPSAAVMMAEVLKLPVCVAMAAFSVGPSRLSALLRSEVLSHNGQRTTLRCAMPALAFTIQNNLLFVALAHLEAPTYQITYQAKTLFTALCSRAILGRHLKESQWFALFLLIAGAIFVADVPLSSLFAAGGSKRQNISGYVTGLAAVLAAAFLSAFSCVYFELMLKASPSSKEAEVASLWTRNIQLGLFATPLAVCTMLLNDGAHVRMNGVLRGFDGLVWIIVVVNGLGGLLIAATMKYADNIVKCFATGIAVACGSALSVPIFGFVLSSRFCAGAACTILASALYARAPATRCCTPNGES